MEDSKQKEKINRRRSSKGGVKGRSQFSNAETIFILFEIGRTLSHELADYCLGGLALPFQYQLTVTGRMLWWKRIRGITEDEPGKDILTNITPINLTTTTTKKSISKRFQKQ